MAKCCCAIIKKCCDNRAKLREAKGYLNSLRNSSGALDSDLSKLAANMHNMATPDNMDQCADLIANLNKDSASEIDKMITKCINKINALTAEFVAYTKEDNEYHTETKTPKKC